METVLLALLLACPAADPPSPETRAVAFLAREVPSWRPENQCYSCHNNGDAARALFQARHQGLDVPDDAIADTLGWLVRPDRWDENKDDGGAGDRRLARLQFAFALESALAMQLTDDRRALERAAALVAADQFPDGSWPSDDSGNPGSPVTYGPVLATVLARRVLNAADADRFTAAIDRADRWLGGVRPRNVPDAAAALLWNASRKLGELDQSQTLAQALIAKSQSPDGGWGPYSNSPPEAFDTAIVLIALASRARAEDRAMIERGRRYLVDTQLPDGSWPATTRPAGAISYAQRISTTAWATMALIQARSSERGARSEE